MQRILISFCFFIISIGVCAAQDTLVFNGQPNWKQSMDIADNCFIYQEKSDTALSFDEAKKQVFVPYRNEWRKQKGVERGDGGVSSGVYYCAQGLGVPDLSRHPIQ